jgi:hypothetical protein
MKFAEPNMRKSDALNVVLCAPAIICFCTSAIKDAANRYSMTQATVQQRDDGQVKTQTPAFPGSSPDPKARPFSGELVPGKFGSRCKTEADFSQRLQGGVLVRFESGLIVVKPAVQPDSLRSTALTTDAIITSSIRSKIADWSQLQARNFDIQTDNGVVTIHAKGESLDQAATVINLALAVPDVRQIVYTMPLDV